jgi:hypothetical protein
MLYLKDAFFLNFIVFKEPIHIFFINIADSNCDKLRIAPIRFGHNFSFKINKRGLKDELRIDAFAFKIRGALDFY